MKKLIVFFAFAPMYCFSQKKGDNAIRIPVTGLTEDKITTALFSCGYGIEKSTKTYYLSTDNAKKNGVLVRLSFLINDSSCTIVGWCDPNYTLMGVKSWFKPVIYSKSGMGYLKIGLEEMIKVATKLSDKIEFIKQ